MIKTAVNVNDIQQLVLQVFGSRKITAITTGNTVVLTVDTEQRLSEPKKDTHAVALDKLYGMFKNTTLLSSDDFAKNKEYEKKLEEEKFKI